MIAVVSLVDAQMPSHLPVKVAVSGWIIEGREGEVGEEEKEMGLESQTNREVLVGFGDLGSGREEEAEEEEEEEDGKEIRYWTSTA